MRGSGLRTLVITAVQCVLVTHCLGASSQDDDEDLAALFAKAQALSGDGKAKESAAIYESLIKECSTRFGPADNRTAFCKNNLALIFSSSGRTKEAERLYEEVLSVFKLTYGHDSSKYAFALNNLAMLHYSANNLTKSIEEFNECLDVLEKANGEKNLEYASCMCNLASAYQESKETNRARELLEAAIPILKSKAKQETYVFYVTKLAKLYCEMGQHGKEGDLYKELSEFRAQKNTTEH